MRQPATACPGFPGAHQIQENRVICCSANIALHSHSIINEPSKLLICNAPEAAPRKFTVIFTVRVRSTSIGAGLRAIRPEATFRDLSTSIDSSDHHGYRRRRIGVGQGNAQEGLASHALSCCRDSLFLKNFYRHDLAAVVPSFSESGLLSTTGWTQIGGSAAFSNRHVETSVAHESPFRSHIGEILKGEQLGLDELIHGISAVGPSARQFQLLHRGARPQVQLIELHPERRRR